MKHLFTLFFILIINGLAFAQIATPGIEPSERYTLQSSVDHFFMPSFNLDALIEEDVREATKGGIPPRFGHKMNVKISPKAFGTWEELPDGGRVWRLKITSFGASSLNFIFEKFVMPKGGEFYLYNEDKTYRIGAFTQLNNKSDEVFATAPVKGETVIMEYYEPSYSRHLGKIQISHVIHAYKNLFSSAEDRLTKNYGDSGSCNNDVACDNTATTCIDPDIWTNQTNSVAMIMVNGNRSCTGGMVNNTNQDGTPYFLSANHCGSAISNSWVFVFNYQSPSCGGPDGNLSQSITGGTLKGAYGPSDFTLFELSQPPPTSYLVYYAGWNKSPVPPANSVGIHHPSGDVKKISFNCDPLFRGSWGNGSTPVPTGNHWIVGQWEDGTTEGGSSGSHLFDENQLVVGQLHGGGASCSDIVYDSYGGLFASWTGGGSNSSRLSNWLDPTGICVNDTLHGAYFIDPPLAINLQNVTINGADGVLCDQNVTPSVEVKNIGGTDITAFTVEYAYDNGTVQSVPWTGPALGFFQSVTVDLPASNQSPGVHTLDAVVLNPNGMTDLDTSNDSTSTTFEIVDGNILTVELFTDGFPEENSYQIQEMDGTVLYERTNFTGTNTLFVDDFCLTDGCYNFVIFDSFGDGLCCQWGSGGYTIIDGGSGTILGSGSEFGSIETFNFCLPFTAVTAAFDVDAIYCIGEVVMPSDASANATGWTWTTTGADVESHTGQTPSFTYSTPGMYTIDLATDDGMGGTAMISHTIEVMANPSPPAQMAGPTTSLNGASETYAVPPTGGATYSWVVTGGTQTAGGSSNIAGITFDNSSTTATVCVSLINAQGCASTPLCKTVELGATSVENIVEATGLNIYPNPTSSVLYVESRHAADRIEVYNILGQNILNVDEPKLSNFIELPRAEGVYFVQITFDGVSVTKRILVNR